MLTGLPFGMRMDWLHTASVIIFLMQMVFIIEYYKPLMDNQAKYENDDGADAYISDFLFHDNTYKSFMTFFVSLQLLSCVLLVLRLKWTNGVNADSLPSWCVGTGGCCICTLNRVFYVEMTLNFVTWIGWSVLCSNYDESVDFINSVHSQGVLVFLIGSFVYFILMLFVVFNRRSSLPLWVRIIMILSVLVPFGASSGLAIQFVVEFVDDKYIAWKVEHMSYIMFCVSHIMLFISDAIISSHGKSGATLEHESLLGEGSVVPNGAGAGCEMSYANPVSRVRIQHPTARSLVASRNVQWIKDHQTQIHASISHAFPMNTANQAGTEIVSSNASPSSRHAAHTAKT